MALLQNTTKVLNTFSIRIHGTVESIVSIWKKETSEMKFNVWSQFVHFYDVLMIIKLITMLDSIYCISV